MATRIRKSSVTLPADPAAEPPAAAPTRRRASGPRAAATRRPATSSRTLRPIVPAEELAADAASDETRAPVAEAVVPAEPAPEPIAAPAEVAALEVLLAAPLVSAPAAPAAPEPAPIAGAGEAAPEAAAGIEAPVAVEVQPLPAALPVETPTIEFVAPALARESAPAFAAPPEEAAAAAAESPVDLLPAEPAVQPPAPASTLAVALPSMVEQLQTEVRVLQGLVAESGEQTTVELSRTTLQMVRMVTGVAHHLDQLAEQVRQIAGVAQVLAQTFTGVESSVATLKGTVDVMRAQTEARLAASEKGQRELLDALAPILLAVQAQRADHAREASLERLEQYRQSIELKQLRQAVEQYGATAPLASVLPKVSRTTRSRRGA